MKIRGSVVSLSFIFPHPPEDEKKKKRKKGKIRGKGKGGRCGGGGSRTDTAVDESTKDTIDRVTRTNARMGKVDRNWTKSGGRLFFSWPGALFVGELAQVPHYQEGLRSGWLSPPHLIPRGQVGSTYSRIRIQL